MRSELRDSLEHVYPDSRVGRVPRRSMTLDVARGGTVAVNVLLEGLTEGAGLRLTVRENERAVRGAQWFRLVDVPVEANTGPRAFIEKEGEHNRHVTRRAPFRVYDAMEPVRGDVQATARTIALRLHVPVRLGARPGKRRYAIEVRCGRETRPLALTADIHKATVPPVGRRSWPYTNWFSYGNIASRHGLGRWSPAYWKMLRLYAETMARGRQNHVYVPLGEVFRRGPSGLVLDRRRLRRIVRTFTEAGLPYVEGGHFAARTGGTWEATTFDISLAKVRATSAEGNQHLAQMAGQLTEEIDRNGWREIWIQHVADEPVLALAADYRILAGMIRKYMPGIPLIDATMEKTLVGAVDIWVPKPTDVEENRDHYEAQRALGDRLWFYTCCDPGGAWLNRLMDMELLRPALLGWAASLYRLDGFLHWGLNHYAHGQDPFEQSVAGNLPAGDTHVVYPGADGPWSSVRFEAQREGIEDLELLRRLRRSNPKAADRIARKVIRSFTQYSKDLKVFRAARRELLRAAAP